MALRLPSTLSGARLRQLWYVPLLSAAMGLMLLRVLLMARLLDVPGFAAYSAGLLVSSSFCMLACLGLQSVLQRDLPVMLLRGRARAGSVLLMQGAMVATGCAAFAGALAALGTPLAGLSPSLIAIALLHGLSQQVFLLATVESRSRGEPLRFAQQNMARAALILPPGIAAALGLQSAGAVLASEAAVSLLLAALLVGRHLRVVALSCGITIRVAWRRLPSIRWREAAALLTVASVGFLVINADRWLAAQWLQAPRFGQYAFAWMVLMVAQSIQVVVNAALFPMLARRFASGGRSAAFRVAVKASLGLLMTAAVAAWPLWWALDVAIGVWFPAYDESKVLLPLFIAVAILRISDFWSSYLIVVGHEERLLVLQVLTASVGVALWWMLAPSVEGEIDLMGIATLAGTLAVSGYAAAALAAWRSAGEC